MAMNSRPMLKLSTLLCSRNRLFQKTLFGENVKDHLGELGFISKAGISTARQNFSDEGKIANRIFVDYCIYKGKASLSATSRLPKFSKLDSGNTKVDRCGSIMLSFSPAVGERKYDWDKKQLFALSATEVGTLISLGPDESCEFFHDPAMKSSNAGQVRKTLQIKPHADGSGFFFSLSVANNILKTNERLSVPVTKAEFAVMRTAFSFMLPRIMGWDRFTNQQADNTEGNPPKIDPRVKGLEWDR